MGEVPAGAGSACLQFEVTPWLFTSLLVYSASQENKIGMRLQLTVEDGAPRLVSCLQMGLQWSRQPKPLWQQWCTTMSSPSETSVPAAGRALAPCRTLCCLFRPGGGLHLTLNKRASSRPLHLSWGAVSGARWAALCQSWVHSLWAVSPDCRRLGMTDRPVLLWLSSVTIQILLDVLALGK